jgi:hypothetical protein
MKENLKWIILGLSIIAAAAIAATIYVKGNRYQHIGQGYILDKTTGKTFHMSDSK